MTPNMRSEVPKDDYVEGEVATGFLIFLAVLDDAMKEVLND